MKKFLLVFALLILSVVALTFGVTAVLDQCAHTGKQNSLIVYSDKGSAVLAYTGDMESCKMVGKASAIALTPFHFLHRT